jgi:hypothetical protein
MPDKAVYLLVIDGFAAIAGAPALWVEAREMIFLQTVRSSHCDSLI